MNKYEIAQILREIAFIVEITDKNPKKGIAYKRAARSIESAEKFEQLVANRNLESLPGIGKEISKLVIGLKKTDQHPYYTLLKQSIPQSLTELTHVTGLTTRKIRELYEELHVTSLEDLKEALINKKLHGLEGFGPSFIDKLEKRLLHGHKEEFFLSYFQASLIVQAFTLALSDIVSRIEPVGMFRRKHELISELHFIITTKSPTFALFRFKNLSFVQEVLNEDSSFVQVLLKQGIKADLKIVSEEEFPFAFLYGTGHPEHVSKLEEMAYKNGHFLCDRLMQPLSPKDVPFSISKEQDIYHALSLNYIPPEMREDYGEIEYAKGRDFSELVNENDLKGTFHCHTIDSDGRNTIEEMAEAARQKNWQYIGISDHSKSSYQANGLSEERLMSQIDTIRKLNENHKSFKIFSGIECDILKDGELDFSNDLLKELDFVIVAVHSLFKQEKEIMTQRIIKAVENPYTTMIAHISGRLLRSRDPYAIDLPKIIDACIANEKIIELNSYPSRLDMDWRFWAEARNRGLKCSINPDAHSVHDLEYCQYGVCFARKGWLKKTDVINALSLDDITRFFKRRK